VAGFDVVADRRRVRRHISLTGQYAALDELQTGQENLRMMARLAGLSRAQARHRAAELLERFDLAEAGHRRVATWSGGMRRRLDLAASLVGHPAVVFLDEPTTGLDPRSRQAVWQVVGELAGSGVTIFLTTQYLEEADRLADRIAVLDGGRVVATAPRPSSRTRSPGSAWTWSWPTPRRSRTPPGAWAAGPLTSIQLRTAALGGEAAASSGAPYVIDRPSASLAGFDDNG
jgi:ABC-2 type transport system ATP-binding protein